MKNLTALVLLLVAVSSFASDTQQLQPFTSDGCSKWPDGPVWRPTLWRECCFKHDISYWMGGTFAERLSADRELRSCVSKRDPLQGPLMYIGVRVGGRPGTGAPYRWGYGWSGRRGYRPLTTAERAHVSDELDRNSYTGKYLQWLLEYRAEHGI